MQVTINENLKYSLCSLWGSISIEAVISKAADDGVLPENIRGLKFEGNKIEIPWGPFWEKCVNLDTVWITATDIIKLNCYNFEESSVKRVIISAPQIWLNDGVFMNGKMLQSVSLRGNIQDGQHGGFSELTFKNCENLEYVDGIYHGEKFMSCSFENCTALTKPIDFYVKSLGFRTFASCTSLRNIHIHNGLKEMGSYAFADCRLLEDVYIPDTVIDLGYHTFDGCVSLKKIHLPADISVIGESMFRNCINLGKVFLPDNLTKIENSAFENCKKLQKPWLPDGLLNIGKKAFWGCAGINEIWIPQSVVSIGEDAFGGCSLTIKGKKGSVAEQYARDNGIAFISD